EEDVPAAAIEQIEVLAMRRQPAVPALLASSDDDAQRLGRRHLRKVAHAMQRAPVRASTGLGEAEDVAVGILGVEVDRAPRARSDLLDDRCAATDQLVVQLADSGDLQVRVEVLTGSAVRTVAIELRRALQMDHGAVARHAGVEVLVHEVAPEPETLLVER